MKNVLKVDLKVLTIWLSLRGPRILAEMSDKDPQLPACTVHRTGVERENTYQIKTTSVCATHSHCNIRNLILGAYNV